MRREIMKVGEVYMIVFQEVVECIGALDRAEVRFYATLSEGGETIMETVAGRAVKKVVNIVIGGSTIDRWSSQKTALLEVEHGLANAVVVHRFYAQMACSAKKESDGEICECATM